MSTDQYLEMSDEDFLKINPDTSQQEEPGETPAAPVEPVSVGALELGDSNDEEPPASGSSESDPDPDESEDPAPSVEGSGTVVEPPAEATTDDKPPVDAGKTKPEGNPKAASEVVTEPDYKAFHDEIMKPFKANGRTVELKTPEEAIRLMQMGAGFGRKLQDLQPHLKTLKMLEKNNLLDETELSYLIDIRNKNPDAIKKLIKDSGIDPLDLNVEDNVSYTPQNHAVSDNEMKFQEALDEVRQNPTGNETISLINQTWDQESKALLWNSPEIISVIQSQRDNGIYDQIVSEIDRMKLLGNIPANTPLLKAYKIAGDALQAAGSFDTPPSATTTTTNPPAVVQPQVIATRREAPKAQVANNDKARAASVTPTTSRKAATVINPLEMADDDFIKQFQGRF